MPPGKYGMQEEWEKEGDQRIVMDFLLPTGIFLKFPVSPNDTIRIIKKVQPVAVRPVPVQTHLSGSCAAAVFVADSNLLSPRRFAQQQIGGLWFPRTR